MNDTEFSELKTGNTNPDKADMHGKTLLASYHANEKLAKRHLRGSET